MTILVLLFGLKLTVAEIHSYGYIYTGTSGIAGFPEFVSVGLVDGQQVSYFDTDTMKMVPRQEWVNGAVDSDFWNRNAQIFIGAHQNFKNNIEVAKQRFNQTGGVHTFQLMYGCELEDDGTTRGYYQYGYDGDDFVSLDQSTLTWTAANPQAVITKVKWDSTGAFARSENNYLENICTEWLKKYVSYGEGTLGRKVAPEVSLLQKDSSSPVICQATGFYPSNIMMTWKKNQDDHNEDVDVSSTLPNNDGSFQKSISLSVNPEEWKKNPDVYSCVVQHVGGEKVVLLNEKNIKSNSASNNIIAIVVGCLVALAVVAAIIGLIVWKKSNGYGKASTNDSDSENSGQPLPKE